MAHIRKHSEYPERPYSYYFGKAIETVYREVYIAMTGMTPVEACVHLTGRPVTVEEKP
jgi:hypothetical protein